MSSDIDRIFGEEGDDFIEAGVGVDLIDGGRGQDLVCYATSGRAVGVNLLTGLGSSGAAGDTFRSIEDIVGSKYNDALTGNGAFNEIFGELGDDVIQGGAGGDYLVGGGGRDRLVFAGSDAGVRIDLLSGVCSGGDAQGDQIRGFENITGSGYIDDLRGGTTANDLRGEAGADYLYGRDGNDTLSGGSSGDRLVGGNGADELIGGSGADQFRFSSTTDSTVASSGRDEIRDFSHSERDLIDLTRIDADSGVSGNQAFVFRGTSGFSGGARELRYSLTGDDVLVYGDVNGDKNADFAILLEDVTTLQASDFLL